MGLLDQFSNLSPEQTQGLLAAAAQMLQQSGPSRTPTSFGQVIGGGLGAYQGATDAARQRKLQEEQAAQAARMRELQMQGMQGDLGDHQAARAQQQALQGAYSEAGGDPQKLIEAVSRINPMEGMKLRQQFAKQAPKFDTKPQVGMGPDGKPFVYILGEDGTQKRLDGTLPRDEMKLANLGGKDLAYNPYALSAGQEFKRTMTPGEASRLNFDKSQVGRPQFNAEMGGFISPPSAANPGGSLTPLTGAPARSPKMTEDQGKATGWLVQAENAFKNMMTVGADKEGKPTAAAKPGFNDALAQVPSFGLSGSMANLFRGADRQKFIQASSSLSEALLRAATGAGVNKEEAEQKVRELTPQFGEDDAVTQQKYAAIPLYIESLKVRAGPGAGMAAGVLKPAKGSWSITRED